MKELLENTPTDKVLLRLAGEFADLPMEMAKCIRDNVFMPVPWEDSDYSDKARSPGYLGDPSMPLFHYEALSWVSESVCSFFIPM